MKRASSVVGLAAGVMLALGVVALAGTGLVPQGSAHPYVSPHTLVTAGSPSSETPLANSTSGQSSASSQASMTATMIGATAQSPPAISLTALPLLAAVLLGLLSFVAARRYVESW